jgi:hypothetical protein
MEEGNKDINFSIEKSVNKPLLPNQRPKDYFKEGQKVIFFYNLGNVFKAAEVTGFSPGDKRVSDGEFPNRLVDLHLEKMLKGTPEWGDRLSRQENSNEVIHIDEYEYLKQNPAFTKEWLKKSSPNEEYVKNYLDALKKVLK